ncbi:hypothetical protein AX15_001929 [Amanita polypyramis BW_CC]|nr:hypothetical protein AX15_001929 [Amanita polypyramis BW_CC]
MASNTSPQYTNLLVLPTPSSPSSLPSLPSPPSLSSISSSRPVSASSSTHPMLADARLDRPSLRSFILTPTSPSPSSATSLTANYIPSKFSHSLLASSTGPYRRKGRGDPALPKMGGGVEAFRSGEARIGDMNDEDGYGGGYGGRGGVRLRWTRFKWILFIANIICTCYSIAALIICLLIWFNVFKHSDIIRVANYPELITSTVAASLGVLTSLIGWAGILLNNRFFLAIYTFSLWLVFASLVIPGYLSYKHHTFNLEGKVNSQWSRFLGTAGRLRVQNELNCCGYFNPFVEATVSATCFSRSALPGCKKLFVEFQRSVLARWYTGVFGIVPAHIFVMVSGLLCSNHVTYRFGKGMMPKAYRLDMNSVAAIMDNYASELAEQYGADVADEILKRSRSNLNLGSMSSMPLFTSSPTSSSFKRASRARYDSIGGRSPEVAMEMEM